MLILSWWGKRSCRHGLMFHRRSRCLFRCSRTWRLSSTSSTPSCRPSAGSLSEPRQGWAEFLHRSVWRRFRCSDSEATGDPRPEPVSTLSSSLTSASSCSLMLCPEFLLFCPHSGTSCLEVFTPPSFCSGDVSPSLVFLVLLSGSDVAAFVFLYVFHVDVDQNRKLTLDVN